MNKKRTFAGTAIVALGMSLFAAAPSQAAQYPACEGTYDPNTVCSTGTLNHSMHQTAISCDKTGRGLVDTVRLDVAGGVTVGWYTWECDSIETWYDGTVWMLNLRGLVEK